ncbi:MAG TPA: sialidase family protein [Anaerolineales bacterium]|nr:sialidase family protein [Anaerolineales bacterium]
MKFSSHWFVFLISLVLITSCTTKARPTSAGPAGLAETVTPSSQRAVLVKPYDAIIDFPAATSMALTTAGDSVYMILGREHSLYVSRSTDGGETFSDPVSATGEHEVHILRVERPAISANDKGQVAVAWLELDFEGGNNKVWYALSNDSGQTFGSAQLVGEDPPGESAMVQVLLDSAGNPTLTWLSGNDLRFARSTDQGKSFTSAKSIGQGACECCQPDLMLTGNQLLIGYRGLGNDESGAFRDAALIRSPDGGETFSPVSFATDSHWYINACPISGPSMALHDSSIYMTWMDGRAVAPDNLLSSDVWFAQSADDGQTFSANVQVSNGLSTHNFLPRTAVGPGGRIHLVWQAISPDAIYYAISDDHGHTFSAPLVIADEAAKRGRPAGPMIAINEQGRVFLAWLDDQGVQLAVWDDAN